MIVVIVGTPIVLREVLPASPNFTVHVDACSLAPAQTALIFTIRSLP